MTQCPACAAGTKKLVMLGLIQGDALVLYRRVGRSAVPWRRISGNAETIETAIYFARELSFLESASGGRREPLLLCLDASKPPHLARVVGGRLKEDDLDRPLRKSESSSGNDGP